MPEINEEEGGFIIKRVDSEVYEYHKVRNANTGTPRAVALFTADRNEYGDKILTKTSLSKKPEWVEFASFHTHPRGFGPFPSLTDLRELFTSYSVNFIYSPDQDYLMRYDYDKENNQWQAKQINLK